MKVLTLQFPVGYNQYAQNGGSHVLHITLLMDTYFKVEHLYNHRCSQCSFVGATEKKFNIINAPQILVIHLCRLTTGFEKIHTFVQCNTELTTDHIRDTNGQQMTYRLVGIIRHSGPSIEFGHYIAYVLIDDSWYEANDTTMTQVSWQIVSRVQVYMLFYERI